MNWIGVAAAAFVAAFVVSWASARPSAWVAERIGVVDHPGDRKIHRRVIPLLGGLAVWLGWVAVVAGGYAAAVALSAAPPGWVDPDVARLLPGVTSVGVKLGVIVAGATLMLALGVWDDRTTMGALPKLVGQIAVAAAVAACGVRVTVFLSSGALGFVITVLWIVTIVNAFNFFDNMDGLCSGTGAVCALLFAMVGLFSGQFFVALLSAALAGALAGFLPHNFHPARMFLGDGGSHLVGYALAVISVLTTFYGHAEGGTRMAILIPVIVLSIPLFDLGSVVWIRWRDGRPIYRGDTWHLSHRFLRMGFSQPVTAVLIYLLTLALGSSAMLLLWAPPRVLGVVAVQIAALLTMVSLLQYHGIRHRPPSPDGDL